MITENHIVKTIAIKSRLRPYKGDLIILSKFSTPVLEM